MYSEHLIPYGGGVGSRPPYSLYQCEDGKWGLVDGKGKHLPAVFDRYDDRFSRVPWEVVTFNEQEGFELLVWYDPCEVWFNFTFDDDAYPGRWGKLLWEKIGRFSDYHRLYIDLLPKESRWIIDAIAMYKTLYRLIDYDDFDREDRECRLLISELLNRYPGLNDVAAANSLLAPILDNSDVDQLAKATLWYSKVELDNFIREENGETEY